MYTDLNQAAIQEHAGCLLPGDTKIWYAKQPRFFIDEEDVQFDKNNPEATHVLLGSVRSTQPEEIWWALQGEIWSPQGQARQLIFSKGLQHTSMSIGDIIQIGITFHLCAPMGFRVL